MHAKNFTLDAYLKRIGLTEKPAATRAGLQTLMRAQLYAVPFENADVWHKKMIVSLIPEEIVDKIVTQGRGGYCYEVNGLFCMALEALGFSYTMLAARPRFNYTERRPKTHMVLRVEAEGEFFLCDLGFGGYGLREPVNLSSLPIEAVQGPDRFRVSLSQGEYLLQVWLEGAWADLYSFDLNPQEWVDYTLANYFNSTATNTIFTQKRLAILQAPQSRTFLIDNELKRITLEGVSVEQVPEEDYNKVLAREFGIRL